MTVFIARHRRWIGGAVFGALLLAATVATAETTSVQVQRDAGIERIRLTLPQPSSVKTTIDDGTLTLHFEHPLDLDMQGFKGLTRLAAEPRVHADGLALELDLKPGVAALSYADERVIFVDLLPAAREQAAANAPAAEVQKPAAQKPADVSAPAARPQKSAPSRIRVRSGEHRDFTRLVFDWPAVVDYRIERAADATTLHFDAPAEVDTKRVTKRKLALVHGIEVDDDGTGTRVRLKVEPTAVIRDFRMGPKVVVDVLKPGSDEKVVAVGQRLTPPPEPKQAPPAVEEVAAKAKPAIKPQVPDAPAADAPPAAATVKTAEAPPVPTKSPEGGNAKVSAPETPPVAASPVLRFDWPHPVAAAVFRHGEKLWCVFDAPSHPDVAMLAASAGNAIGDLTVLPQANATVLRMTTARPEMPHLSRDGHAWLLSFGGEGPSIEPIVPRPELGVDSGAQLVLPVLQPSAPIAVTDPDTDENLVVVPIATPGSGLRRGYRYPTFRLLAAEQGIAIQPLIDTLEVRSSPEGVLLSSVQGLGVSPMSTAQRVGARLAAPTGVTRALAFRGWVDPPPTAFVPRRQALLRALSEASGEAKRRAQLELAHFDLGNGLDAEALADAVTLDENGMTAGDRATTKALIGVSNLLLGRVDAARKALADPSLAGIDEAKMWSAAAATAAGDQPAGSLDFERWSALVLAYPRPLRHAAQPLLIGAALSRGQHEAAELLLTAARGDAPTPDEVAWLDYLDGRLKQARGDNEGARASFDRAAASNSRRANAYAEAALVDLGLAEGKLTHQEAVERLEALLYAWRGDNFEIDLLMRLGEMYAERHDYPLAMRAFRKVASNFHGNPKADAAAQRLSQLFETVFLNGDFEDSTPMAEVALYNEFKELTPAGEKGRQIILGLSQRLMALDLPQQVIAVIEPTLRSAPADAGRTELGMVLAEAYARTGNWEAVIDTLKRTTSGGGAAPLNNKRDLLAAKALMQLGRRDEALARLATIDSVDAVRTRAALQRRNGDWKAVAETIDHLLESETEKAPAAVPDTVIDLSVARILAGDSAGVGEIARTQAPAMAGTADEAAFNLLTGDGVGKVPDRESLRRAVDEAVRFRDALKASPAIQKPETTPP